MTSTVVKQSASFWVIGFGSDTTKYHFLILDGYFLRSKQFLNFRSQKSAEAEGPKKVDCENKSHLLFESRMFLLA